MAAVESYEAGARGVSQTPLAAQPGRRTVREADASRSVARAAFGEALAAEHLNWSRHARQRLTSRRVQLSPSDLARIAEGVDRAAAKGARDSLVLLNQLALIVNVPNRTVLTALDSHRLREGVVTNIDSTVFV